MSDPQVDAAWLAERVTGSTARELSSALVRLIDDGRLSVGVQLPTIREFARAAGVSPGTVMSAWGKVRDGGRLEMRRRGGTVVVGLRNGNRGAGREEERRGDWSNIEMSLVTPDPSLQPPLEDALAAALDEPRLHSPQRDYITARLLDAVAPTWPFEAEAWTTAGGGTEALVLATASAAGGGLVAVEEPVSPGYLEILKSLDITPIGIEADEEGPTVASLRTALVQAPAALMLQPSGAYARSGALSSARAAELAEVLRTASGVWVIEDDATGPLAVAEPASLGGDLGDRVVRVRSYCKAYGIDLRTAVIGGSATLVDRIISQRSFGMAANSRILQNALAHLITDTRVDHLIAEARAAYGHRRETAVEAFQQVGLHASSAENGLVVWVEVPDETRVLIDLARHGIALGAGSKSFVRPDRALVRVSVLQLPDESGSLLSLAETLRAAVDAPRREYFE